MMKRLMLVEEARGEALIVDSTELVLHQAEKTHHRLKWKMRLFSW
jgi:hypothetical protein